MPLLPGEANGRAKEEVNVNDIQSVGVSVSAFSLTKGDKVQFEDTDTPLVVKQKIRKEDNSPVAHYVAVIKNDQKTWLNISSLTRRDAEGQPIGEFRKKAIGYPNFITMYNSLLKGKTFELKGDDIKYSAPQFDAAGNRTEGTTTKYIYDLPLS